MRYALFMASNLSIKNQNISALNQAGAFLATNNLQMPAFEAFLAFQRKHPTANEKITFSVISAPLEAGWRWRTESYSYHTGAGEECFLDVSQYVGAPGQEECVRFSMASRVDDDFPSAAGMAVIVVRETRVRYKNRSGAMRCGPTQIEIEAHLAPRL